MLGLALGFLEAVLILGAFCGGVFLGCWLCDEDGTPARIGRGNIWRRRNRRRRRDWYDSLWDRDPDTGYDGGDDDDDGYGADDGYESDDEYDTGGGDDADNEYGSDDEYDTDHGNDTENEYDTDEQDGGAETESREREERAREAARQRRRLLDEQAAFRALQHYSAEHAYGLTSPVPDPCAGRSGLD